MFVSLAVLSFCSATAQAAFCYSHNGVEIQNSEYYDGDGLSSCKEGPSTCCIPGESCGEDLLCHSSDGHVTRQYCTDPMWPSEHCSALCPEYGAAGVELTKCEENVYCCGPDNEECCKNGEGTRIDKKGQIVAIGTSTLPVTSTTPTTSTDSSTTTGSETAATRPFITNAGDPSSPTSDNASSDDDGGLSAGAGAGIGVGCAAALAIIGGLIWFLLRERKKRRALESELKPEGYYLSERKGDGYYQPSTQPSQETQMSSPTPQIYEAHSEPHVAELYGDNTTNQRN